MKKQVILGLLLALFALVFTAGRVQAETYVFPVATKIKASPSTSVEALGVYQAGQSVNYDSTVEAEGYLWLSYVSYSGERRYVTAHQLGASVSATTPTLPATTAAPAASRPMGHSYLISTPQIYQANEFYCAPTAVNMMLASQGIAADQWQLAKEMGTGTGTYLPDAVRVLNRYMYGYEAPNAYQAGYRMERAVNTAASFQLFKQRVMQNIKDGLPLYYSIDAGHLYGQVPMAHAVAGIGYIATPDGRDIAYLYIADSSFAGQGTYMNGAKVVTPEALFAAMTASSGATESAYAY